MPSGKFVLRLDPLEHQKLKRIAERESCSLNELCARYLKEQAQSPLKASQLLRQISILNSYLSENFIGLILFGSTIRGEARKSSDIDLLIVLGETDNVRRRLYRIWDEKIASKLDPRYSPQFAKLPNPEMAGSLWLEVAIEGRILYDRNELIQSRLSQIRERIAEGFWERKYAHGHPYWVKKKKAS